MHDLLRQDAIHPFAAALLPRAAVRPALRQGSAFLAGLLGGWAVLYGALIPFGLGLTLGFAEDCFAACAAGAVLGLLLHGFGALSLDSICLLCAIGAAVAARWLWPGRFRPALLAGCGALGLGAVCFAFGPTGGGVDLLLTCGADALLAGALGFALALCSARRWKPPSAAGARGKPPLPAVPCWVRPSAGRMPPSARRRPGSPAPVQRLLCWPPDAGWKPLPPMRAAV